nr:DNA-directed RNA polymerase II subunit RPB2 [Tanacetum cinerariifolium]
MVLFYACVSSLIDIYAFRDAPLVLSIDSMDASFVVVDGECNIGEEGEWNGAVCRHTDTSVAVFGEQGSASSMGQSSRKVVELSLPILRRTTIYKIIFDQIYLSKSMMTKSDGETATSFPKAATLRNLTYYAPLYVDVTKKAIKKGHDCEEVTETQDFGKVFIREDLMELGECPYDQGGYFIINESEKVLISQEKMDKDLTMTMKDLVNVFMAKRAQW